MATGNLTVAHLSGAELAIDLNASLITAHQPTGTLEQVCAAAMAQAAVLGKKIMVVVCLVAGRVLVIDQVNDDQTVAAFQVHGELVGGEQISAHVDGTTKMWTIVDPESRDLTPAFGALDENASAGAKLIGESQRSRWAGTFVQFVSLMRSARAASDTPMTIVLSQREAFVRVALGIEPSYATLTANLAGHIIGEWTVTPNVRVGSGPLGAI